MPDTSSTRSEDVLTQLVTGPSLREVATNALRTALEAAYPSLDIDPVQAMIGTPTWIVSVEQVTSGPHRFESLTDALVRLTLSAQLSLIHI